MEDGGRGREREILAEAAQSGLESGVERRAIKPKGKK